MGKNKNYETPFIKRTQVETESGFCAASIIDKDTTKGIKSTGHEQGEVIDANDWQDEEWK